MNRILVSGKLNFNPPNLTKKHNNQGEWKRTAIVEINDRDICNYYSWFVEKRHGLKLLKPQRGTHVTFVADRKSEIRNWERVSKKYQGRRIKLWLDLDMRTDGNTWWLNVHCRDELHDIRKELGLGRPFFGLHMTIGNVWDKHTEHGHYIHTLYKNGFTQ